MYYNYHHYSKFNNIFKTIIIRLRTIKTLGKYNYSSISVLAIKYHQCNNSITVYIKLFNVFI